VAWIGVEQFYRIQQYTQLTAVWSGTQSKWRSRVIDS